MLTKHDQLVLKKHSEALAEFNRQNKPNYRVMDLGSMPVADKNTVLLRAETLLSEWKQKLERDWTQKLPVFESTVFVESPLFSPQGMIYHDLSPQMGHTYDPESIAH